MEVRGQSALQHQFCQFLFPTWVWGIELASLSLEASSYNHWATTSHISMLSVFLKQRVIKSPWALEITHVVSIKKSLIESKLPAALSLCCVSSATNKDWHGLLNCFFICWMCFAYCVIIYSKNCYSVLNFLLYFFIIFIITSANI